MATATSLAERVTIALIASSTLIVSPGSTPSLEGSCAAACSEIGICDLQRHGAFVELLEQEIERHHLGDRGGVAQSVLADARRACARCWRRRRWRRTQDPTARLAGSRHNAKSGVDVKNAANEWASAGAAEIAKVDERRAGARGGSDQTQDWEGELRNAMNASY